MILMCVGFATARLLVERLVVPEPDARHTEQRGRRFADARMEREPAHRRRVFPQVDALQERLLVARLLFELAPVARRAHPHRRVDRRAKSFDLAPFDQPRHAHVPIASK